MLLKQTKLFDIELTDLSEDKLLINTINAHSYNVAQKDKQFAKSLQKSDVLIPDGVSVVGAIRLLTGKRLKKIAGADLFFYEMKRMQDSKGKVFFLGSSSKTLETIRQKAREEYPDVQISTYSPPYKAEFSNEDNQAMLAAVNAFRPDVLFIGMTAPKQEKWSYSNYPNLQARHICSIGAVFDFYAGTVTRAPHWMIKIGMEWLYRLIKEPKRMWRRYLIGNVKFVIYIVSEFIGIKK